MQIYLVTTFNPHIGAVGISIQWHFSCHMLELTFISTVSSQTPLGIGMHSLHLLSPLLKVLRTLLLDSHHLWDLETSLCNCWPWWMNVYWCITSKIFWFWYSVKLWVQQTGFDSQLGQKYVCHFFFISNIWPPL